MLYFIVFGFIIGFIVKKMIPPYTKNNSPNFIIEILTGISYGFLYYYFKEYVFSLVMLMIFFPITIVVSYIDSKEYIIPNKIIIPGAIMGIAVKVFESIYIKSYIPILNSFLGFSIGFIIFLIIFLVSKEKMGMGDVKYIGFIGIYIGMLGALKTIMFASIAATVFAIPFLLMKKMNLKSSLPFGPFLSIGAYIYIIINII